MSTSADNEKTPPPEPDFDLDLQFLPAWAQKPSADNRYANYAGGTERRDDRRGERRDRPPGRRDARPRRDQAGARPGRGEYPDLRAVRRALRVRIGPVATSGRLRYCPSRLRSPRTTKGSIRWLGRSKSRGAPIRCSTSRR